jgi:hypothetical protein
MTKRNKPRVRMVTGSVRITSMGFTIRLSKLKTRATKTALPKALTSTPGRIFASRITARALRRSRRMNFMISVLRIKKGTPK